jgi:hypothetical protein
MAAQEQEFALISFREAVKDLDLGSDFAERVLRKYWSANEEIASIEANPELLAQFEDLDPRWRESVWRRFPTRYVRYYGGDANISGDIDLDKLCYQDDVAGIVVDGDLVIEGTVFNWEIDAKASFLAARRNLSCLNLIAGCADIVVRRDARIANAMVSSYNHGRLEIRGDAYAEYFIVDDHHTSVGRDVHGYGWHQTGHGEINLPESDWIDEIRPEFRSEFFEDNGDVKCANGNVDLVRALLAGRDILKHRQSSLTALDLDSR